VLQYAMNILTTSTTRSSFSVVLMLTLQLYFTLFSMTLFR
jgi:hypothetical protein